MSTQGSALLADRGAVSVLGPDAVKLLQGLVTNDMALLESQPAVHAALLSPQGKILFDFLAVAVEGGVVFDTARDMAPALAKRIAMYKLRSAVTVADATDSYDVVVSWGSADLPSSSPYCDPRLPALGVRALVAKRAGAASTADDAAAYHAHRIGLGVPEGGKDYAFGDTFPHEAMLDQLSGVSLTKGCYVGQEIVARMEHRGTARKRVVPVVGAGVLPASGTPIMAGEIAIGTLGSTAHTRGLALVRLDRAAEFEAQGISLMAGDVPVSIALPPWARFALASHAAPGST